MTEPSHAPRTPVRSMTLTELSAMRPKAIAIAASTGGPDALRQILSVLRERRIRVPIAITQHLGSGFSQDFSGQIAKASGMPTHIAQDKLVVLRGNVYIAAGGKHMLFAKEDNHIFVLTDDGPSEHHCKPSANPMLRSMAQIYGTGLLSIVLTGMGDDGIEGIGAVVEQGGYVIAQDEATSAVWGMPKAVHDAGLAHAILPLSDIAHLLSNVAT